MYHLHEAPPRVVRGRGALQGVEPHDYKSGGRLCTLIGVPWRGVSFSTLSTGRFVLNQYICKEPHDYIRDKTLYTTTNKCLQCLTKLMHTVF